MDLDSGTNCKYPHSRDRKEDMIFSGWIIACLDVLTKLMIAFVVVMTAILILILLSDEH